MKKILTAVDFSRNTEEVINQTSALAKAAGAKVWIVHVTADKLESAAYETTQFYDFAPEFISAPVGDVEMARNLCADEYRQEHHALLDISERLRKKGIEAQAILMKGNAAELILEKAKDLGVSLIVMGSHGHGMLRKMVIGSVSEAVLQKCPCSVLIVPPAAK